MNISEIRTIFIMAYMKSLTLTLTHYLPITLPLTLGAKGVAYERTDEELSNDV